MSDSNNPHDHIAKTYEVGALLDMPIDQLRDLVYEHFRTGEPGVEVAVKLLLCVAHFLMHGAIDSEGFHRTANEITNRAKLYTLRAVELLEIADSLDGLGLIPNRVRKP